MIKKITLIFILCISAIVNAFTQIVGPTSVCAGETVTYKFYSNAWPNCQSAVAYLDLNGRFRDMQLKTKTWSDSSPYEFTLTFPNESGVGVITINASTCGFPTYDMSSSLTVKVGEAPSVSSSLPGICSIQESVTLTASSRCGTLFSWQAPSGWYFTHNNSNVITNGPNQVVLKAAAGTPPGAYASVSVKCGISYASYINIPFYGAPSTPIITGPTAICTYAANQTYSFSGSQDWTKQWSISYGTQNATLVGPTNGNSVVVDFNNNATNGQFFSLDLKLTNRCGTSSTGSQQIVLSSTLPSTPVAVQGPGTVCNSGGLSYYNLGGMTSGAVYDIQPAQAVASRSTSIYGQLNVDWNNNFTGTVAIKGMINNGCGSSGWTPSRYVTVVNGTCTNRTGDEITDGSAESADLNVAIFPNPAAETATIKIPDELIGEASVEITDVSGFVVDSRENVSAGSLLTIGENMTAGLYIIRIKAGQVERMMKFVKQ
jgi:hypothetical protein